MTAVELRDVSKRFGSVTAVDSVSFTIDEGEVFGFLGPNGAGKSTTIDALLGYIAPTEGEIELFGKDARREAVDVHRRIGVLPDGYGVFDRRTGRDHVAFAVRAKGADDDPDELLARVGLADAADRNADGYSKGMRQRLLLAMGLAGSPDLLVLDEPSTGLDPNGVRLLREIVLEERDRGAAVFFSSHILEQVEAVADRVGILNEGSLVAIDTIEGLREAADAASSKLTLSVDAVPEGSEAELEALEGVYDVAVDGDAVTVACGDRQKVTAIDVLRERGAEILNVETERTPLEDLFVSYTGGSR